MEKKEQDNTFTCNQRINRHSDYNLPMRDLFSKRRSVHPVWWILLLAAGFLMGLGAIYFHFTPRILTYAPQTGRLSGGFAAIEVEFSVPMDPACTEAHVLLEPNTAIRMDWQDTTLIIKPLNSWPIGGIIQLTVQQGACSTRGLPLPAGSTWSFTASGPRITFVTRVNDTYFLMAADSKGSEPTELLRAKEPIQDYAVSSRGEFIVYSTGRSDSASDLWLLPLDDRTPELLLSCGGDACRNPSISPDETLVAFERSPMEATQSGGPIPLRPHVESIRLEDRTVSRVSPDDHIANNPIWSSTGWLSYYDATNRIIVVDDLHGGKTFIPDTTGDPWSWFPDSQKVVFPEMDLVEGPGQEAEQPLKLFSNLYLVTLSENARTNISSDPQLVDTSPAVSPDGRRLAFTRDYLDSRWTPGRQLWLMDLGDLSASPITNIPGFGHSSLHWSPDGSALAFMRYHETAPYDPSEVWRIDADGTNALRIASGSYLPQWLP
jgi:Tol biopolymer transport system component